MSSFGITEWTISAQDCALHHLVAGTDLKKCTHSVHFECASNPTFKILDESKLGYPLFDIICMLRVVECSQVNNAIGQVYEYAFNLFNRHVNKKYYPELYGHIASHYVLLNILDPQIDAKLIEETMNNYTLALKHCDNLYREVTDIKYKKQLKLNRKIIDDKYFNEYGPRTSNTIICMIFTFIQFCSYRFVDTCSKMKHSLTCMYYLCTKHNLYSVYPFSEDVTHRFLIKVILDAEFFNYNHSKKIRFITNVDLLETILKHFCVQILKGRNFDINDEYDIWKMMAQFYLIHKYDNKIATFCCKKALRLVMSYNDEIDDHKHSQLWCYDYLLWLSILNRDGKKYHKYIKLIDNLIKSNAKFGSGSHDQAWSNVIHSYKLSGNAFKSFSQSENFLQCTRSDWINSSITCSEFDSLLQNQNISVIKNIAMSKECNFIKCRRKNIKLKVCKRCKSVYYCSRACQKKDWKYCMHKDCCQPSRSSRRY